MTHHQKGSGCSIYRSKNPHFFQVILEETIRDGKLGIPRNFIRKHGKQLSSPIQLEVPSGAKWQVELTKCDGRVLLQKGWREFVEHYSLDYGYFVVFRYVGKVHFHVLIFDKSASEIDYPYTTNAAAADDDDGDDDVSVEHCDGVSGCNKSKEKSNLPCPRPPKKMRTDSPNQTSSGLKSEVLPSRIGPDDHKSTTIKPGNPEKVEKSSCSAQQVDGGRSVATEALSCTQHLTATEGAHVSQISSGFKSNGNPIFMVVMKPTFLYSRYRMGIPSSFARKFFTMNYGNLTLCDSTGKTWPAEYFCDVESTKPNAYLLGGWRAFAEDNNLNVSDVCVFELVKYPEILMKVVIYPSPIVENASKACRLPDNESIANRVKTRSSVSNRCPSSSTGFKEPKIEENENSHSHMEILDDYSVNQTTKKKLPSAFFDPCKMMRTNPSGSNEAKGIKLEKQKKSLNELEGEFNYLRKDNIRGIPGAPRCLKPDLIGRMQPLTRTEKERACKMMRTSPSGSFEAKGVKLEKQKKSLNELGGEVKYLGKDNTDELSGAPRCLKPDHIGKMQPLTRTEKERACIRASAFESANPFFSVLMQPSYVCYKGGPLVRFRLKDFC
ncbi:hypothetical protein PTKIN_Ptkin07bG0281800 [Pterospermum kingtungense]